jgi:hypothetical protein
MLNMPARKDGGVDSPPSKPLLVVAPNPTHCMPICAGVCLDANSDRACLALFGLSSTGPEMVPALSTLSAFAHHF